MKTTGGLVLVVAACLSVSADESDSVPMIRIPFSVFEKQNDSAELDMLRREFDALEPLNITATNFAVLKLSSGGVIVGDRDVGLRIERFLCAAPETELGFVRIPFETNGVSRFKVRIKRVRDDAEVEKGRARNRAARRVFAEFLSEPHPDASGMVQELWLLAATSVWIDGVNGLFRETESTGRRREEDGIPSAEALLEWFAENESFCESVRVEARARLESIKTKTAPKPDAQPVATTAVEEQEQDTGLVPEAASSSLAEIRDN